MIEPTSKCNFRCPFCPTGRGQTKRSDLITFDAFKRILGLSRYTLQVISFWNYGESLLNRDLVAMIHYASNYEIWTQLSTNGSLLTESRTRALLLSGLDRLIISIDTPDASNYTRYRVGGSFSTIVTNIERAVHLRNELGSSTLLVAQYMIMKDNENTDRMREHAAQMGVDYAMIKTIGIGSAVARPSADEWSLVPVTKDFQRFFSRDDLRSKVTFLDIGKRCSVIWDMMVVNSDTVCVPCCRDQLTEFPLGSALQKGTLLRVWNSGPYREFRRRILQTQRSATMCLRCGEVIRENIEPGLVNIRY